MSIVWLASYPKSGNTWIRVFLANYLANQDQPVDINALSTYTTGEAKLTWFEQALGRDPRTLQERDLVPLRPKAQAVIAKSGRDPNLVKTHSAQMRIGNTPMISPEVTRAAIYVVRNPLDVAVSLASHLGRPAADAIALMASKFARYPMSARQMWEVIGAWWFNVETWTESPPFPTHVLRYEDLHADTEGAFAKIVEFLGLPLDTDRLARAVAFSSFDSLRASEKEHGFVERPPTAEAFFREGQAGGWRNVLSADEARHLVHEQGRVMAKFGYDIDALV